MMLAVLASTGGCKQPAAKMSDDDLQQIRAAYPGIKARCLDSLRFGGIEAWPERVDQCFEMSPPKRWRGIWVDGFEAQQFCNEPSDVCRFDENASNVWLTFANGIRPTGETASGHTFIVEFIGRRTLKPGGHGHMGMFAHEMIVDHLIAITSQREEARITNGT